MDFAANHQQRASSMKPILKRKCGSTRTSNGSAIESEIASSRRQSSAWIRLSVWLNPFKRLSTASQPYSYDKTPDSAALTPKKRRVSFSSDCLAAHDAAGSVPISPPPAYVASETTSYSTNQPQNCVELVEGGDGRDLPLLIKARNLFGHEEHDQDDMNCRNLMKLDQNSYHLGTIDDGTHPFAGLPVRIDDTSNEENGELRSQKEAISPTSSNRSLLTRLIFSGGMAMTGTPKSYEVLGRNASATSITGALVSEPQQTPESDEESSSSTTLQDDDPTSRTENSESTRRPRNRNPVTTILSTFYTLPWKVSLSKKIATEMESALTIPSTTNPEILKSHQPWRPSMWKGTALIKLHNALASKKNQVPDFTYPLRLANVDYDMNDESTLYGQTKTIKSYPEIVAPVQSAPASCNARYPPGSVMRRRYDYRRQIEMNLMTEDKNLCKDPFVLPACAQTSLSAQLVTWMALRGISSVSAAARMVGGPIEGTLASEVVIKVRDGAIDRARRFATWASSSAYVSEFKGHLPYVLNHLISQTTGVDEEIRTTPTLLSGGWNQLESGLKMIEKYTSGWTSGKYRELHNQDIPNLGFTGAQLASFKSFYVVSKSLASSPVSAGARSDGTSYHFKNTPSLSFASSGGALDALYLVGCAEVLLDQFRDELFVQRDGFRFLGCGYGSIVAATLALGLGSAGLSNLREIFSRLIGMSSKSVLGGTGCMSQVLEGELNSLIPEDVHMANRDNLFVSVTAFPTLSNEILSVFTSKKQLLEALLASCHIPVVHESPRQITDIVTNKTFYAISGLFTSRIPLFDDATITISAVPGEANISPWSPRRSMALAERGAAICSTEPPPASPLGSIGSFLGSFDALSVTEDHIAPFVSKESAKMLKDSLKNGRRDADLWMKAMFKSGNVTILAFKAMV